MTPGARLWLEAARPRTLSAAIAPVLVGSALAWHDAAFRTGSAGLCLIFALLVQIGTNFANDYYDFMKGADTNARVGPRRAVAAGLIAPKAMRVAAGLVFTAAFVAGLGLIGRGGPWLLVIGLTSIACGLAYTGGPFPLGYLGLGDLFVFLFFGLVAVGATYFVQTGRVTAAAVWSGVAIGSLAANILLVNNYRDAATDAAAGKRTLVVRFGRGFARAQFGGSLVVAFAMPFILWREGFAPSCLLPLALAPMAWRHRRRLAASETPGELIALLGDTGKLLALYAVLFAVGIAG